MDNLSAIKKGDVFDTDFALDLNRIIHDHNPNADHDIGMRIVKSLQQQWSDNSDITDMVKRDLDERKRIGTEEYGEPLTTETEIDALQYLYEELLDAACYVRMQIEQAND